MSLAKQVAATDDFEQGLCPSLVTSADSVAKNRPQPPCCDHSDKALESWLQQSRFSMSSIVTPWQIKVISASMA